jgi:hypothetical protein
VTNARIGNRIGLIIVARLDVVFIGWIISVYGLEAVSENNLKFFILFNSYRAGRESREWRFSLLSFYPRNIVAILNKIRALIASLSLNPLESHAKVA